MIKKKTNFFNNDLENYNSELENRVEYLLTDTSKKVQRFTDWDNITSGQYLVETWYNEGVTTDPNCPAVNIMGILFVYQIGSYYKFQFVISNSGIYIRYREGSNWGNWFKILNSSI